MLKNAADALKCSKMQRTLKNAQKCGGRLQMLKNAADAYKCSKTQRTPAKKNANDRRFQPQSASKRVESRLRFQANDSRNENGIAAGPVLFQL